MCKSDCKGITLSNSILMNKKYKEMIKKLQETYQLNNLAKKYNERQKEEKVSIPEIAKA